MNRPSTSGFGKRFARLSLATLALGWASVCVAGPETAAGRAQEQPYVVAAPIGLIVTTPPPLSIDDPAASLPAAEAEARTKRAHANGSAAATLLAAVFSPLAVLGLAYPPALAFGAYPFMGVAATVRANESATQLEQSAARLRQATACMQALAAEVPSLPERLAPALASEALLSELQDRGDRALRFRVAESPVMLSAGRGDEDSMASALTKASNNRLANVLEIHVGEIRFVADSQGAACAYKIVSSVDVRLWNVSDRRVVSSDQTAARDAEVVLSLPELPALLEQPRALQARLANLYEETVLAALNHPRLRFAGAESLVTASADTPSNAVHP
jgi:hypothetical protein